MITSIILIDLIDLKGFTHMWKDEILSSVLIGSMA